MTKHEVIKTFKSQYEWLPLQKLERSTSERRKPPQRFAQGTPGIPVFSQVECVKSRK